MKRSEVAEKRKKKLIDKIRSIDKDCVVYTRWAGCCPDCGFYHLNFYFECSWCGYKNVKLLEDLDTDQLKEVLRKLKSGDFDNPESASKFMKEEDEK